MATERRDIEDLVVWALVAQGLGWDSGGPGIQSGLAQMMEMGTIVSSSGVVASPSVSLFTDDDALVVASAIRALPPEMAAIVFQYGRASSRPDWAPEGYGEPQPLLDKRGRPRVEYENPKARKGERKVLVDRLAWSQRQATVDFFRAGYRLWWQALDLLGIVVNSQMQTHFATGPAAPAEPWLLVPVAEADMPAAAAERLRAYAEGTGTGLGVLTMEELRESAQAPVRARASVWASPELSSVEVAEREDGVAEAGRQALRERLGDGSDS